MKNKTNHLPYSPNRLHCLVFILGLGFASMLPTHAADVFNEDFSGAVGTIPQGWIPASNGNLVDQSYIGLSGNGTLLMERMTASTAGANNAVYLTADFGSVSGGIVANGIVTATFSNVGNDRVGILARATADTGAAPKGYWAFVHGTELVLAKDPIAANFTEISKTSIVGSATGLLQLRFEFIGSNLSVVLFNESDLDNPLASINVTDSSYSSGVGGLYTRIQGARTKTFDSYSVTTIPEASNIALVLALSLFAAALGFRSFRAR